MEKLHKPLMVIELRKILEKLPQNAIVQMESSTGLYFCAGVSLIPKSANLDLLVLRASTTPMRNVLGEKVLTLIEEAPKIKKKGN